jgi:orotate phosphoribosyltransferase
VPLVVATALITGLPYVIVRKSAKVTTGTQAVRAAESLARAGVEVVTIVAVLDRREVSGASLGGVPFQALLRIEDLRVAIKD